MVERLAAIVGAARRCWNWQTGQTQTLLSVRTCGFKSHPPYQTPDARVASAWGTRFRPAASASGPMLDSPGLRIAVRRDPPTVEDLRSTTVSDDPVQRRDLILLERARDGDLGAFNDLVVLYQDQLFALVVRMVPDRDQASDAVQEAFFSAFRNLTSFRGGSVKSWLNRICVNAAMDTQRARKRRPVQPYPELEDESWQPPAGAEADPERTALDTERTHALSAALAQITTTSGRRSCSTTSRATTTPRSPT